MKTALVTGGAGGLGRALADALEGRGWRLVLVDRDVSTLTPSDTRILHQCDLTDAAELQNLCAALNAEYPHLDLVIYNAGVTQIGGFGTQDLAAHRRLFEVNYFAAITMAQALLMPVRAAKGTHLAMSSVAGFAPLYHRTAYAASKHALQGFFSSLRSEERRHGVSVRIAAPSFVATNPGATAQYGLERPGSSSDGIDAMDATTAAEIILKGHERGRDFIPVGRVSRLSYLLNRLTPAFYQYLMERRINGH
ncbi:SDR family NAD(P)-dependent oxidoreductase [Shimia biformata]|uniref:SDR family NAD(P)-dependent oxidoreductase n=1 Tax=Shimia biformata TaxID=1294299 RepID=UPI001951912C|nr:SDR family NAD(P)-dependent oxidoreductase [Shimia biformata]